MSWIAPIAALALFAAIPVASAQEPDDPGGDIFAPGLVAPKLDFGADPEPDGSPTPVLNGAPIAAPPAPAASRQGGHDLILEAHLAEGGAPLMDGIIWRIFSAEPTADGQLRLVASARGGRTVVQLGSGDYLVHAAFGRAGATKRVTVADDDQVEAVVLNAGGLMLSAIVGEDRRLPSERLTFEVLQESDSGDFATIVPRAEPNRVLRLAAGRYHVISRYGAVNATVRADIDVKAGKLTEAVMRHTGAEVTLKLVSSEGGEALANTSWAVLNQDGATMHESSGAFPSLVLAEGTNSAVASHQGQIFSRDFTIEPGMNRDIEVRLSDLVQPELEPGSIPEISGGPLQP